MATNLLFIHLQQNKNLNHCLQHGDLNLKSESWALSLFSMLIRTFKRIVVNTPNYINLLEQYNQHEHTIHSLIESMMISLNSHAMLEDRKLQQQVINDLSNAYPFVELLYSLDAQGIQLMDSVYSPTVSHRQYRSLGKGSDRSKRPYMVLAKETSQQVVITSPYLSHATHQLSISGVQHLIGVHQQALGYLVININLERLIAYLNGDGMRSKFHPWFKAVYGLIGAMLIIVASMLLYSAGESLVDMLIHQKHLATSAFGSVIIITLAMSIFDLGKTILEEEVLVNKDIRNHDTTRRTISRFMAAIIIAVSIEALLLMFKSLLHYGTGQSDLMHAVLLLLSAVAMMSGLGVYLWLSNENKNSKLA